MQVKLEFDLLDTSRILIALEERIKALDGCDSVKNPYEDIRESLINQTERMVSNAMD